MYEFRDIEAIHRVLAHLYEHRDYYALEGLRLAVEDRHGSIEFDIAEAYLSESHAGCRRIVPSDNQPLVYVDSSAHNGEPRGKQSYIDWMDMRVHAIECLLLGREVAVDV